MAATRGLSMPIPPRPGTYRTASRHRPAPSCAGAPVGLTINGHPITRSGGPWRRSAYHPGGIYARPRPGFGYERLHAGPARCELGGAVGGGAMYHMPSSRRYPGRSWKIWDPGRAGL
ncbi:MAG: hypothetical protein MPJ22_00630 [Pirellulales bacterium]|nr:hypothetical protein [Pirellulales bacterium]